MNKDVKKIISEAFNELYKDLTTEAENTMSITDKAKADKMINRVKSYGDSSGFSNSGSSVKENETFNYILNALISEYKTTEDPNIKQKIKAGIQGAFFPSFSVDGRPNKTLNILLGKWPGKDRDEVQNAAASAYETFLNNFDQHIESYKPGSGSAFGSIVLRSLQNGVYDVIQRGLKGRGLGGTEDVHRLSTSRLSSIDDPLGDNSTLGATLADTNSSEYTSARELSVSEDQELLNIVNGWLKNNVSEKQYIAFRELTQGKTPEEIAEENPAHFKIGKDVSRNFEQLLKRKEKDEDGNTVLALDRLSDLLSHAKNRDIDLKNIVAKNLRQTISQNTEFSGKGNRSFVDSAEAKSALRDLSNTIYELGPEVLSKLGIKNKNDFKSGASINKIIEKLKVLGMGSQALDIENDWDNIKRARTTSGFGNKESQFVDKVKDNDFATMFEGLNLYKGFDIKTLIERVMSKL